MRIGFGDFGFMLLRYKKMRFAQRTNKSCLFPKSNIIATERIETARYSQGYNARKVISDAEAWHWMHLHIKNQLNIMDIGSFCLNYQNYQNLICF